MTAAFKTPLKSYHFFCKRRFQLFILGHLTQRVKSITSGVFALPPLVCHHTLGLAKHPLTDGTFGSTIAANLLESFTGQRLCRGKEGASATEKIKPPVMEHSLVQDQMCALCENSGKVKNSALKYFLISSWIIMDVNCININLPLPPSSIFAAASN